MASGVQSLNCAGPGTASRLPPTPQNSPVVGSAPCSVQISNLPAKKRAGGHAGGAFTESHEQRPPRSRSCMNSAVGNSEVA
eukprot:10420366-Alexandrium_andersonii.AAC.1